MQPRGIVVIGGSAGGLEALATIVQRLPATLPACVLVVLHSSSNGVAALPQILKRVSALPVAFARDGDALAAGRMYVAPPDFHLLVGLRTVALVHGPRENAFRPAVDPLFRTAAREFGPRVIGVVLSGALSDGTYGLSMIKHHGGLAIVQDPADAIISSMPQSALRSADIDEVLPAMEIAAAIERFAGKLAPDVQEAEMPRATELEPQQPDAVTEVHDMARHFGPPSALTCPIAAGRCGRFGKRGRSLPVSRRAPVRAREPRGGAA